MAGFHIGERVRLTTGGPILDVVGLEGSGVTVCWFGADGSEIRLTVPESSLVRVHRATDRRARPTSGTYLREARTVSVLLVPGTDTCGEHRIVAHGPTAHVSWTGTRALAEAITAAAGQGASLAQLHARFAGGDHRNGPWNDPSKRWNGPTPIRRRG